MTREDIKQLHEAFEEFDSATRRMMSARGAKRRFDEDYEVAVEKLHTAKATLDALCLRLGIEPGAPAPFAGVPHPRTGPGVVP